MRKCKPPSERFWPKVHKTDGCWFWTGSRDRKGYGRININYIPQLAHRIAWELACSPVPAGLFVLHKCDNPPCVRPDHLYVGTHIDNMRDARERRRMKTERFRASRQRGEARPHSKLTENQVREIRALREDGATMTSLAAHYGVAKNCIRNIVLRKRWAHV
jgi:hypothetical protein